MNDAEVSWFVRSRGRVLGPFPFERLEVLKNQGRLAKFDEVSRDRRTWVNAASMPELFPPPKLRAPLPDPAAAQPQQPGYAVSGGTFDADTTRTADAGPSWYYMTDAGQSGPVVASELVRLAQAGVVRSETYVWNADLVDWVPARDVPMLGLSTAEGGVATAASQATAAPAGTGLNVPALAGFILGLFGLFAGALAFLTASILASAGRNREVLLIVMFGMVAVWGLSALLAVVLGPMGMVRANRAGGERRGFGLGLTGMILGIVGLLGLLALIFIVVIGALS